jgi:paraquat-inducible protein B
MTEFPLYTSLKSGISDKDLTATQKADFVKKIEKMNPEGHELIYALIKTFYINNKETLFTTPYNGKFVKNNVTFDMDDLPVKLRQIIYKFIKIHTKKVKEDKILEKDREHVESVIEPAEPAEPVEN